MLLFQLLVPFLNTTNLKDLTTLKMKWLKITKQPTGSKIDFHLSANARVRVTISVGYLVL